MQLPSVVRVRLKVRNICKAADAEWEFIKKYVIDHRDGYEAGREWYWLVNEDGRPYHRQTYRRAVEMSLS